MSNDDPLPEQASIDRLQKIARVLGIPADALLESAEAAAAGRHDPEASDNPTSAEMVAWFDRIHDPATRRLVVSIVRSFVPVER